MITGDELRDARELANLTQPELATLLGNSQRTIVNWEAHGVPVKRTTRVERALGEHLARARAFRAEDAARRAYFETPAGQAALEEDGQYHADQEEIRVDPVGWGLRNATDQQLVGEVLSRMGERRRAMSDPTATIRASRDDYGPAASEGGDPDAVSEANEGQA